MDFKLPYSTEAERTVIGCIFLQPELINIASQQVRPEMFYNSENKTIYSAMVSLNSSGKAVDYITVFDVVKTQITPFSIAELVGYTNQVVRVDAFEEYLNIIKDKWIKRQLVQQSLEIASNASADEKPADELIADQSGKLTLLNTDTEEDLSLTDMLVKLSTERDSRGIGRAGVKLGHLELDAMATCGNSDLIILAARPGQGKTAFAVNAVKRIGYDQNTPVAFISLEMAWQQILERLEANITGIDYSRISTNNLTHEEKSQLAICHNELSRKPIYIKDMAGVDLPKLRAVIALLVHKYGVKIVFIDYLQLITGKGKDLVTQNTEVSKHLKRYAKEFNIPIVALAQLSRKVEERTDKMPQLSDLRETGQIEQDADLVWFLMRPAYYEMESIQVGNMTHDAKDKIIIKQAKYRHGIAPVTKVLNWSGEKMRIE